MKQAAKKKPQGGALAIHFQHRVRETLLIVMVAVAAFLLLSLMTYHASDPGWSVAESNPHVANAGGKAGAWFADVFLYLFGYPAFVFPILLAFGAWSMFRVRFDDNEFSYFALGMRGLGLLLVLCAASGLANLHLAHFRTDLPYSAGGILGAMMGQGLASSLNSAGTTLVLITLLLCGVTLFSGVSWVAILDGLGRWLLRGLSYLQSLWARGLVAFKAWRVRSSKPKPMPTVTKSMFDEPAFNKKERVEPVMRNGAAAPIIAAPASTVKVVQPKPMPKPNPVTSFKTSAEGDIPDLNLLDEEQVTEKRGFSDAELTEMSTQVEAKLLEFGVEAKVVEVMAGPVVTRFELQLAPGMKVSKLVGIAKDIARSLSVVSVRVVEVIPGKPYVGLELPNEYREIVRLKEVLAADVYQQAASPLSLALGKDIAGHPIVVDLGKMPHLLVAGTTGSGKSVCLNAMLLSFLYKAAPKDVRMILVDPKMLELSIYEGIPHLLTPVVTDMKEASNALRWCVAEMDRRYRLMASLGVRNLAGFNKKLADAQEKGEPILDPFWNEAICAERPALEHLPYIVVLIDEFADMMMVVGKKVEELIARIAQKARAAGIHLILATQRPSVDVITGLIKANIPTRIAFQVSARVDSRTILDQQGAEHLLGHGDMLYLAPGTGVPVRVHGAFVSDQEVHNVVNDLKARGAPEYLPEILEGPGDKVGDSSGDPLLGGESDGEADPLYDQAVYIVTETRRASISNIQRRLKIGYNRAARLIEEMEQHGIVTPMEQNGSREVLAPPPPKDD